MRCDFEEFWSYFQHFVMVTHCYREANKVADALSNFGCSNQNITFFVGDANLPRQIKGEACIDRLGLPSF